MQKSLDTFNSSWNLSNELIIERYMNFFMEIMSGKKKHIRTKLETILYW